VLFYYKLMCDIKKIRIKNKGNGMRYEV